MNFGKSSHFALMYNIRSYELISSRYQMNWYGSFSCTLIYPPIRSRACSIINVNNRFSIICFIQKLLSKIPHCVVPRSVGPKERTSQVPSLLRPSIKLLKSYNLLKTDRKTCFESYDKKKSFVQKKMLNCLNEKKNKKSTDN